MKLRNYVIKILLLIFLSFSVITDNTQLMNVYIALVWVTALFGILLSVATLVVSINPSKLEQSKVDKIRQALVKNRTPVNLIFNIISITIIAYAGWIFTAIVYACAWLTIKFFLSCARDEINKKE